MSSADTATPPISDEEVTEKLDSINSQQEEVAAAVNAWLFAAETNMLHFLAECRIQIEQTVKPRLQQFEEAQMDHRLKAVSPLPEILSHFRRVLEQCEGEINKMRERRGQQ